MNGRVEGSVLGLGLTTLKFYVIVGRRMLTPVGTDASPEAGTPSTKKIPAWEWGSEGG